ncbi:MAG: recombinase family protein, partial [Ardenticatenales bacterium]|nr:recombinase family protein [Ardenticatenales bacterium]
MRRVALCYLRRSLHREGIDLEGHSKERQKQALYNWCQSNGYEVEWYEDFDGHKSGYNEVGRPGWMKLKEQLYRSEVLVVVTESVARSHRNAKECLVFVDEAGAHGVAYVSIKDGIDTRQDNPAARFQLQVLAAMAEMWSSETSSHMKGSLKVARQKGQYVGTPPFGTIRDQNKKLIPDPGGAWFLPGDEDLRPEWTEDRMEGAEWRGYYDALVRCYELYASEIGGYDAVAHQLNSEGWRYKVRHKKGQEGIRHSLRAWKQEDVRRCICNWPLYAG